MYAVCLQVYKLIRKENLKYESKMILWLEHNLFKNVSKGPAFLWQTQIQMIE